MKIISERCIGCGACENACPKSAIEMRLNEEGFQNPYIDEKKCIDCGKCKAVCPEQHPLPGWHFEKPDIYAVMAEDEVRYRSSSGGVFTLLAETVLEMGGFVCGVLYDDDLNPRFVLTDDKEQISAMRKSKYAESIAGNIYNEVKKKLETGRNVIFTGLPCQIAALSLFLEEDYENLYTVDLICAGIPPLGIFNSYKEAMERRFGKEIQDIDFRDKKYLWTYGNTTYRMRDGEIKDIISDPYTSACKNALFRKTECRECRYARFPRCADITIGDFWNVKIYDARFDDRCGTSMLCINSPKGSVLADKIRVRTKLFEPVDFEFAKKSNNFHTNRKTNEERGHFYELNKTHDTYTSIVRALNRSFDIGLVGNWSGYNYGAHLTHYALFSHLKDNGYDVLMVEHADEPPYPPTATPTLFRENPYPKWALAKLYPNIDAMKELNEHCDGFVVGSDQLWNNRLFGHGMESYMLAFVNGNKRKISYGTSFGRKDLTGSFDDEAKMRFLLGRFQKISVREESGVDILHNFFSIKAEHVLDPVFLCNKKHYIRLIDHAKLKMEEPYVFCYILYPDEEKIGLINRIADHLKLKIVCIADAYFKERYKKWQIECIEDCMVEDWLYLLYNSSFVIADSYHAFCFSLIFEKQIISCAATKMTTERMMSLSKTLGTPTPKTVDYFKNLPVEQILFEMHIDYENVNRIRNKEVVRCSNWLENALHCDIKNRPIDLLWDAFGTEYLSLKKELNAALKTVKVLRKKLYRDIENEGRQTVVFGLGACFKRNIDELKRLMKISYVCDNDADKWGREFAGIECVPPNHLRELENPFIIVTIESKNVTYQVVRQMKQLRIDDVVSVSEIL